MTVEQAITERLFKAIEGAASLAAIQQDVALLLRSCADQMANAGGPAVERHPLGFLACRWGISAEQTLRVHLWDQRFDWVQDPDWQIHDHVFSFTSIILAGAVLNKTYDLAEGRRQKRSWALYEVTYSANVSRLTRCARDVGLRVASSTTQGTGSKYSVAAGVLHRSALRSDRAITALATTVSGATSVRPRVVGDGVRDSLTYNRAPELSHISADEIRSFASQLCGP